MENPWERPFGMVTRWKGVFTLHVMTWDHTGKISTTLAVYRAEELDQILAHAARHELKKVSVLVKESRGPKEVQHAKKSRR